MAKRPPAGQPVPVVKQLRTSPAAPHASGAAPIASIGSLAPGQASTCKVLWIPVSGGHSGLVFKHVREALSGCHSLESVYIGSYHDRPPALVEGPREEAVLVDPRVWGDKFPIIDIISLLPKTVRRMCVWATPDFKDQDLGELLPDLEVLCMRMPPFGSAPVQKSLWFANLRHLRHLRLPDLTLPKLPHSGFGQLETLELSIADKQSLAGVKYLPRLRSLSVETLKFYSRDEWDEWDEFDTAHVESVTLTSVRIGEIRGDLAPVFPWFIESLDICADPRIDLQRYKQLESLELRESEDLLKEHGPAVINKCLPPSAYLPALRSMKLTMKHETADMRGLLFGNLPSYTELRSLSLSVTSGTCSLYVRQLSRFSKLEHLSLSTSVTLFNDGMPEALPSLKTLRAKTNSPAELCHCELLPPTDKLTPPEADGDNLIWKLPAVHLM